MNVSVFIARRLAASPASTFSGSIIRIAQLSVILGLAVMLISVAILKGYQDTITDKVYSFDGHVLIKSFQASDQTEPVPIAVSTQTVQDWARVDGARHIQPFGIKPVLLKTDDAVQGVLIKGFDHQWDTAAFAKQLVAGRLPKRVNPRELALQPDTESNEVIVSQKLAQLLGLKINDDIVLYFLQNPPRFRKLVITGLYETSLEEFDTQFIIGDLAMLRHLSGWGDSLVSGYQVIAHQPQQIDQVSHQLNSRLGYKLQAQTIKQVYPQLFEWLELINRNVELLIILITIVACFNLCSTLLIMILERTRMIGILKAMGGTTSQLISVFFFTGMRLILTAIFWGNLIGLLICWLQYQFRLIPLDPANYYIGYVPIALDWIGFLVVNLVVIAASAVALVIPSFAVTSVRIVRALRFA